MSVLCLAAALWVLQAPSSSGQTKTLRLLSSKAPSTYWQLWGNLGRQQPPACDHRGTVSVWVYYVVRTAVEELDLFSQCIL
jgi:hypothetical protein